MELLHLPTEEEVRAAVGAGAVALNGWLNPEANITAKDVWAGAGVGALAGG
jgi:hypothetical protein